MNIIDIVIRANDNTGPGFGAASRGANMLQGVFQGIGQAAAGMLAELPGKAIEFFSGAIGAASDLGETVSKNRTIFGAAADELIRWASDAPRALGMTSNAALDATGTFGNLFTQLGVGVDAAREMSQANVKLAADFASFHNADPTAVLEAMTAAYRGEFDAVQAFVPLLNAANVEEKALIMTKKASKDALTEQDKALAVNALMLEGAGHAAGDFARTSDSASNRAKTAAAAFEEMKVKIGNGLLPAWTALLGFVTGSFLPAMEQLGSTLSSIVSPAFAVVADSVRLFVGTFTGEGAAVESVTGGWMNAIITLASYARTAFDEFTGGFRAMIAAFQAGTGEVTSSGFPGFMEHVGNVARAVFDWMAANIPPAIQAVSDAFSSAVTAIAPFWEHIKANENLLITIATLIGVGLVAAFIGLAAAAWSAAAAVIAATWPFIAIVAVIWGVITALRYAYDNFEWFRTGVDAVVAFFVATVPPAFEMVKQAVATAFEWISSTVLPAVSAAFGTFMVFLQTTFLPAVSTVWNAVTTVVGVAAGVVMEIVTRIGNFISDNWNWISGIASAVWGQITNIFSTVWQIISNIFQLGLNLITGNWSAAFQNIQNIQSAVTGFITSSIQNFASAVGNAFMLIVSFAGNMVGATINKIGEVIGFFMSLPGKIMGAIGGLAGDMLAAGGRIIQGLIDGIKNKIGGAVDVVKNGLSAIRNLLPFSPAKEGPFSGRGWTLYSGQALASGLAEGIKDRTNLVRQAAGSLMDAANGATRSSPGFPGGSAGSGASYGAAAGGAGTTHNWYVQGSIRSERDLIRLVRDAAAGHEFSAPAPAGGG